MRIFLDVGGHYGETLDVALDPRWAFDRIYCFEPAESCRRILRGFRDTRLDIVPAGLSNRTGKTTLYGTGLLGASVYADKRQLDSHVRSETIALVKASDWLSRNTTPDDEIYLKLNCEGSECDVLEDLLDSGLSKRLKSVYVDFDVRKIPSQAHRQETVERRLRERNHHFVTPDTLSGASGSRAVRKWLTTVSTPRNAGAPAAFRYRLGLHRPPYVWAASVARAALPRSVYEQAARRVGAQARRRARAHGG
ncbi:FkbM family methyltransferase [Streptomyces sp. Y2F8-2]|uniref:FkbM family methyltransferase n=1 Tax=Streptomyces sp. Y2F8-2 TaxID=2759675 RepID=UPI001907883D|nr:FkbM family methyltransferase [Streptomyces sp. Y2F8-2]